MTTDTICPGSGGDALRVPRPRRAAPVTLSLLLLVGLFLGGCGAEDNPGSPVPDDPGEPLVLMVPGFVSRLDEAYAAYGESLVNGALQEAAGRVPVIGDRIAAALPRIELPGPATEGGAFAGIKAHFAATGVDHVEIPAASGFNTQQSVAANAAAITDYLAGLDNRRVTLLTHSKGGLDALHALLENRDLWGTTVVGWVALQAPFHGSPVAENVPAPLAGPLLSAFGGDQQALLDLRPTMRGPYMSARAADIAALTAAIPVSSCHSAFTTVPGRTLENAAGELAGGVFAADMLQDIAGIVAANLLNPEQATSEAVALIDARARSLLAGVLADIPTYGLTGQAIPGANDGLVAVSSTLLDGADSIALSPAGDHASPVKDAAPFRNFWTAAHRNEVATGLVEDVRSKAGASF